MMKFLKVLAIAGAALALTACGTNVPSGSVGVKVKNFGGSTGVQSTPLGTGWHGQGFGEDVILFPVTQKQYSFARTADINEEVSFSDNSGLPISGDLGVTIRVDRSKAPALYERYRLTPEELINGPIRLAIRSEINRQANGLSTEQIYSGGSTRITQAALVNIRRVYSPQGIEIIDLEWLNPLRYPTAVVEAIQAKTTREQQALAARADEARATALANAAVATARGEAEATRLRAQAISANPQVLQQDWINKWNGVLPTTVAGDSQILLGAPR